MTTNWFTDLSKIYIFVFSFHKYLICGVLIINSSYWNIKTLKAAFMTCFLPVFWFIVIAASHNILDTLLWMNPRTQLVFWDTRAHSWVMLSFLSANTPGLFPQGFSQTILCLNCLCLGLPCTRGRVLHLALLNFMRFHGCPPLELLHVPLHCISSLWCQLYCSALWHLQTCWGHFIPLSMSLINKLKCTGPSLNLWGSPLVTHLHLDIHWPLPSGCNHPSNSSSTQQFIHQIHFPPI